nr:FecR domain-containing protein [uncultured Carboxylicivirga sp.]
MKHNESHKIDWELLAKDMAGELTPAEHKKLNIELSGDKDLLGQMGDLWGDAKYAQELQSIDTDKAWQSVQYSVKRKGQLGLSHNLRKVLWTAATVIVALLGYVIIKNFVPENNMLELMAQNEITKVKLADGTIVDLNKGSLLKYPEVFNAETRMVQLQGEAFFDVARNVQKPFIIETNNLRIRVLGTSFNVRANEYNGCERVTVASGTVEVTYLNNSIILKKGEVADFNAESNQLVKLETADVNYQSWKTREIEFNNVSLNEAIAVIESVYNVQIEADNTIPTDSLLLTATFSHDDLNHVLNVVCQTFNLQFVKQDDKYRVETVR